MNQRKAPSPWLHVFTQTDLEQNLGSLEEEAVQDSECIDQRHRVYEQTEEPREAGHRKLDIDLFQVFAQDWHCLFQQMLQDGLVQESTIHRSTVVSGQESVAEDVQSPESLFLALIAKNLPRIGK